MSYPELTRFDFHRNGHANRRDPDAEPRILFCGFDRDEDRIEFHVAGDRFIRSAHVSDAALDFELVNGMLPWDALRLGARYEAVRIQEKAASGTGG